jgi:hypothetical protein
MVFVAIIVFSSCHWPSLWTIVWTLENGCIQVLLVADWIMTMETGKTDRFVICFLLTTVQDPECIGTWFGTC